MLLYIYFSVAIIQGMVNYISDINSIFVEIEYMFSVNKYF